MNTTYKMAIALVLCIISVVYLLNSAVNDIGKNLSTEENKYKKHLGEKYIIDKDTLTIVDYSIFNENFILSDGRKVNYVLTSND